MTRSGGGIAGWLASLLRRSNETASGGAELDELRRRLSELECRLRQVADEREGAAAPIIVEQIRIEKVVVDKIEYHNNFGALGIKELKGKLNIGANYTITEDELPEEGKDGLQVLADLQSEQNPSTHRGNKQETARAKGEPKVRIRAKR